MRGRWGYLFGGAFSIAVVSVALLAALLLSAVLHVSILATVGVVLGLLCPVFAAVLLRASRLPARSTAPIWRDLAGTAVSS